jgi:NAD(P)-dependent dehydrogenase (short-subunit alcohol dehydrogenase family)
MMFANGHSAKVLQMPRHDTALYATLAGLRDRLRPTAKLTLRPDERLDGQTVLITGANRGLGLAIAEQLGHRGARLLLACRSGGPEAAAALARTTGNSDIHALSVDLAEHASITALVETLSDRGERLDRVVLNAAVVPLSSRRSAAGLDLMFHVNYLSAVDLCEQLLARELIGGGDRAARIVVVSSEAHRWAEPVPLDRFSEIEPYETSAVMTHYGRNKLYLTAYAWELGRVLDPRQIGVFVLEPGAVATDIAREAPGWMRVLLDPTMRLLFQAPRVAAEPVTWLCCAHALDGTTQRYVHMHTTKQPKAWAVAREHGEALRTRSIQLLASLKR